MTDQRPLPQRSDQDPSMDLENVNAAYRLLWEERDKLADENQWLRTALQGIFDAHLVGMAGDIDAAWERATDALGREQPCDKDGYCVRPKGHDGQHAQHRAPAEYEDQS